VTCKDIVRDRTIDDKLVSDLIKHQVSVKRFPGRYPMMKQLMLLIAAMLAGCMVMVPGHGPGFAITAFGD
jgi:hypothetical protein